ncbi:hypothetical protein [Methylorubrum extorquens]|uniref:hypothetical protein n=1 Tax=Methylorubrum extorquens TaxID=408 RepID=UPI00223754C5|nr:hypothetical protein [Methylorubrum extorquens]UYW32527.1 hypothetical protein OKB92_26785 [Methylorubrum extorquens]
MPLYGPSTATATVAANTNVVSITGMDLNIVVQQGMTINLGARDRAVGDAWIINTVVPNGTNGGTITTAGSIPTGYNSVPFLIDTRGFNGTDSSFAAAVSLKLLATLTNLLGTATNLFAGSRQLVLDKVASTAIGRVAFAIAGRTWGDIAQRSLTYTPTGGQAVSIETLAVRAFPDGTTPTDALLFDLTTGTGDLRKGAAVMVAASTVDLSSAPMGKVLVINVATINGFGAGKNLDRLVHFVDAGSTLVHNATSLILQGGANIAVRAGDWLHAVSDVNGNWRVLAYFRADGTPLILPAAAQRASSRNRIRNGTFAVNQRAVSGTVSLAAGQYGHDGWKAGAGGCTYGFSTSGGVTSLNITAGTLVQVIEGGLYLPEGGDYVLSWAGTAQARAYQGAASGAYAATPVRVAGVAAGGNTTVEFGLGTLGLPQFEPGTVATSFEFRSDELSRCRRYFQRNMATLGQWYAATALAVPIAIEPAMRVAPTLSLFSGAAGAAAIGGAFVDVTGFASGDIGPTGGFANLNTGSATNGANALLRPGVLALSAEL